MNKPETDELLFDEPRPIPILLLLDVSSSMGDEDPEGSQMKKIDYLNQAVREMQKTLNDFKGGEEQYYVGAITFGRTVSLIQPFTNVSQMTWTDLQAGGVTPLGPMLEFVTRRFENLSFFPPRSGRPYVLLVSDGAPTDSDGVRTDTWQEPFADFLKGKRSSKSFRMAVAIGKDADQEMLNKFIEGTGIPLFYAETAAEIRKCFKLVTTTTTAIVTGKKEPEKEKQPEPLPPSNPPPRKPIEWS